MPETKTTESTWPEQPQGEVLDLTSAAEFLKVSKPTFYRWLAQEKIKGFKAGTQWRFYRKDLEEFLRSGEPQATQEVEGLIEQVDAARAARELPPIDWEADAQEELLPVATFVKVIFEEALAARASDVHFELNADEITFRYRVDGVLNEVLRLPRWLQMAITSRVKMMADLELTERRLPQHGRIRLRWQEKGYDLRVTTLPSIWGEAWVCRILDQSSILVGMDRLGMSDEVHAMLERKLREPWGLVVFTGPTGSGRTTTAYSSLHLIRAPHLKLVSIEDPVEYQLRDTTQVHINRKAGLTWPVALRTSMRFDPDVVMVGETRDVETAELTMQAALTGHLVLTTLLPVDAAGAITRYLEMGVEPFLIASALTTVVAQRLVRRVCPECREEHRPSQEALRRAGLTDAEIEAGTFARGKGCPSCRQTGYKGRTGVFELLEMDEKLRELTVRRASTSELREAAIAAGMVTLKQDGLHKAAQGITTVDEVMRVLSVHDLT